MAYGNGSALQADTRRFTVSPSEERLDLPRETIGAQLDRHDQALDALHSVIDSLEKCLAPVLLSYSGEGSAAAPGRPPVSGSPVVCGLKNAGFKLDAAIGRLTQLLPRIEL